MRVNRFEKSRIIGNRALQLAKGAPFLIDLDEEALKKVRFNTVEIAKLEFAKGVIKTGIKKKVING